MKKTISYLAVIVSMLALTACGGGGGGGGPETATIDASSQKDLAVAATEAAKQASSADNVPLGFKPSPSSPENLISYLAKTTIQNFQAPTDYSYLCSNSSSGGTYTLDFPTSGGTSGTVTGSFSNCDVGGTVINGNLTITYTSNSFSYTANLTYTYLGMTDTLNYSASCSYSGSTLGACTYSASGTGLDGRTYTVSNLSVSGDSYSGWTVSGTVTDPDHGNVNFTTPTPVLFNCANGAPNQGVITITNGTDTATITYNDCNSFTVTFNGVSTPYNWADI